MKKGQHCFALVLVIALAFLGACHKKGAAPSEPQKAPAKGTPQPSAASDTPQPQPAAQPQSPAKALQGHVALPSKPVTITSAAKFAEDVSGLSRSAKAGGFDTQAAAAKAGGADPQPVGLRGQPSPGDCAKCCVDGDCGNVCCFTPGGPENGPSPEPGHEPTDCGTCNRKSCIDACEGPPPSGWTNDQCVAFCNCCSHH